MGVQVYLLADPGYDGNVTVPVLWDKKSGTIVNNESSEIIRMMAAEFNEFCRTPQQEYWLESDWLWLDQ